MAQVTGETGHRSTLHLEIGNAPVSVEPERFNLLQHVRHGQRHSDDASLRAVETGSGDGNAAHGAVFEPVDDALSGLDEIRGRQFRQPAHVLLESLLHLGHGHFLAVAIPVHHPVEPDRNVRQDIGTQRDIGVKGAGSADAQDLEGPVLRLYFAGGEIHVSQGVQLGHHDVDIVRSDAV